MMKIKAIVLKTISLTVVIAYMFESNVKGGLSFTKTNIEPVRKALNM